MDRDRDSLLCALLTTLLIFSAALLIGCTGDDADDDDSAGAADDDTTAGDDDDADDDAADDDTADDDASDDDTTAGDDDASDDDVSDDDTTAGDDDTSATVSFTGDVLPIVAGCACHTNGNASSDLDFTPAAAYAELVDVPSVQHPSLDRVEPGDPEASFLVLKVREATPPAGDPMPPSGAELSAAEVSQIEQWISEGAANN